MLRLAALAILLVLTTSPALATPGRGDDADGATVECGSIDAALFYDRLDSGPAGGEDLLQIGITHGLSDRVRIGGQASFARQPGTSRKVETVGAEVLFALGKLGPIDSAFYATYDIGIDAPDAVETRFILEHDRGRMNLRFNLIATRELASGESVELGYAFSGDYQVLPKWRLGLQGFGEFGSFDRLLPHGGHALGPIIGYEIEPSINLRAGYLFTLGNARDDTKGQFRIGLEFGL